MNSTPHSLSAAGCAGALLAGLALLAGCVEAPPPPPPSPPVAVQEPAPPPAPTGDFSYSQGQLAAPPADAETAYRRGTPPAPARYAIVEEGATPPAERVVIVDAPPPAPLVEEIPGRPGPRHVWLIGHWRYRGGHYIWIHGRWAVPPRPGARFVAPHWEQRAGSYVFCEGYWQVVPSGQ